MARKRKPKNQKPTSDAAVAAILESDLPPPDRQLPAPEPRDEAVIPVKEPEPPKGPWRNHVRAVKTYPQEGIAVVDAPGAVGIQADEDRRLSDAEKEQAREAGFGYSTNPYRSYLDRASPDAYDRAEKLADRIAEQRRAEKANARVGVPF